MSYGNTAESVFTNLAAVRQKIYDKTFPEMNAELGSPSARIVRMSDEILGASTTFQMSTGRADSARSNSSMDTDYSVPQQSAVTSLEVRLNDRDASKNDFRRIDVLSRISMSDRIRAGNDPSFAVNLMHRVVKQSIDSAITSISKLLNSPASGKIAAQNGAAKLDDAENYTAASTYASGTEARIVIDGGAIAMFSPNNIVDLYDSSGNLLADSLLVGYVNVVDYSIGLKITDASTVANLDALADNAEIFRSGERGQGFIGGFSETFKKDITAGDSWFGGLDRSTTDGRNFLPIRLNTTATTTHAFGQDDLNDMAEAIGTRYRDEESSAPRVLLTGTRVARQLREAIGNEALKTDPPESMGKYTFGETAAWFVDPTLGKIAILGDAAADNNSAKIVNPGDWKMLRAYSADIEYATQGPDNWAQMEGQGTTGSGSYYYRKEGSMFLTPYCSSVNEQAAVYNIHGRSSAIA